MLGRCMSCWLHLPHQAHSQSGDMGTSHMGTSDPVMAGHWDPDDSSWTDDLMKCGFCELHHPGQSHRSPSNIPKVRLLTRAVVRSASHLRAAGAPRL